MALKWDQDVWICTCSESCFDEFNETITCTVFPPAKASSIPPIFIFPPQLPLFPHQSCSNQWNYLACWQWFLDEIPESGTPADGEQAEAAAADSSVGPQIKTSPREWKQTDVDDSVLLVSDERCTSSCVQLCLLNTNILFLIKTNKYSDSISAGVTLKKIKLSLQWWGAEEKQSDPPHGSVVVRFKCSLTSIFRFHILISSLWACINKKTTVPCAYSVGTSGIH